MSRERRNGQSTPAALEAATAGTKLRNATLARAAVFLTIFAVLQGWYSISARGTWIERMVINQITVKSAAAVIQILDPATGVLPIGSRLQAPGGGINIINGCEGVDVLFLMTAAMLVAPIPLKARLSGIMFGVLVVLGLNQVRVIGLFYAFRVDRNLFDMLHGVVAPLTLIAAVAGCFLGWLSWHAPSSRAASPSQ